MDIRHLIGGLHAAFDSYVSHLPDTLCANEEEERLRQALDEIERMIRALSVPNHKQPEPVDDPASGVDFRSLPGFSLRDERTGDLEPCVGGVPLAVLLPALDGLRRFPDGPPVGASCLVCGHEDKPGVWSETTGAYACIFCRDAGQHARRLMDEQDFEGLARVRGSLPIHKNKPDGAVEPDKSDTHLCDCGASWCPGSSSIGSTDSGERCDDCGRRYLVPYLLSDATWAKIHERAPAGLLCSECAYKRAEAAGVAFELREAAHAEGGAA